MKLLSSSRGRMPMVLHAISNVMSCSVDIGAIRRDSSQYLYQSCINHDICLMAGGWGTVEGRVIPAPGNCGDDCPVFASYDGYGNSRGNKNCDSVLSRGAWDCANKRTWSRRGWWSCWWHRDSSKSWLDSLAAGVIMGMGPNWESCNNNWG